MNGCPCCAEHHCHRGECLLDPWKGRREATLRLKGRVDLLAAEGYPDLRQLCFTCREKRKEFAWRDPLPRVTPLGGLRTRVARRAPVPGWKLDQRALAMMRGEIPEEEFERRSRQITEISKPITGGMA